jgi:hypothetical protein
VCIGGVDDHSRSTRADPDPPPDTPEPPLIQHLVATHLDGASSARDHTILFDGEDVGEVSVEGEVHRTRERSRTAVSHFDRLVEQLANSAAPHDEHLHRPVG